MKPLPDEAARRAHLRATCGLAFDLVAAFDAALDAS